MLGAAYPYLTMLGLHWGFSPITLQNLELYGGDIIEGVTVCSVFAQTGITAGLYLKGKKHSKIREVAGPTLITGVFAGVTQAELVEMYIISVLLAVLAYWKHRENIVRLVHGNERKTYLLKKNKVDVEAAGSKQDSH